MHDIVNMHRKLYIELKCSHLTLPMSGSVDLSSSSSLSL